VVEVKGAQGHSWLKWLGGRGGCVVKVGWVFLC